MPHPQVTVTLPDGSTHTADAHHRARTLDGGWQYATEIRTEHPTIGGGTTPYREHWWLPADQVRPIDGQDYGPLTPPPDGQWIAGPIVGRDEVSIHQPDCRLCDSQQAITTEAARDLMLAGRAYLCLNCHPEIPWS